MTNFFGKPLDQINANDILKLIDTPEGQIFEIKSELAAEKNKKDPWLQSPAPGKPRKAPSDYAKQNIFKEIIAFANSEGGWLVLGLTETSDHPKRVKEVAPLPDCHELAERFKRAAYDWIDPPLPSLQCRGIEMGSTPGEGVIVFRVPRSLAAPHRLYKKDRTQEAYKRVSDESKPMRMREIQDLTLDIARGQERIDKEFNNSRNRYLLFKPRKSSKKGMVGFYIALVPTTGPVTIDRPYFQNELFKRECIFRVLSHNREKQIYTIDSGLFYLSDSPRPILRGGRCIWSGSKTFYGPEGHHDEELLITLDIYESGIVQLSAKVTYDDSPFLLLQWIISDLINTLCIIEMVRTTGSMTDAEYAMELELRCDEINDSRKSILSLKEFDIIFSGKDGLSYPVKIGPEPLLLPKYRVVGINDFVRIIKEVTNDLYNAIGEPHIDNFHIDRICI